MVIFILLGMEDFFKEQRLLEAPFRYNLADDQKYTNNHEDGFFSVFHRKF